MRRLIESTPSQPYRLAAAGAGMTATITGPLIRQIIKAESERGGIVIRGPASNAIEVLDPYVVFYIQPPTGTDLSVFDNIQVEGREQTFDVYGSAGTFIAKQNLTAQFVWSQGRLGFHLVHTAVSLPSIQVWNRTGAAITLIVRMEIYGSSQTEETRVMRGEMAQTHRELQDIGSALRNILAHDKQRVAFADKEPAALKVVK